MQSNSHGDERRPENLASAHPPILVIGLGNPILGDDGVGWRIAQAVQKRLSDPLTRPAPLKDDAVEIDFLSLGGLSLMERMIGYQRVIIIDAINSGSNPLGTVKFFPLEELPTHSYGHLSAAHDTTLQQAILIGQSMGANLPEQISIVGVESQLVYDFTEELSHPVAAAVPIASDAVIQLLIDMKSGG